MDDLKQRKAVENGLNLVDKVEIAPEKAKKREKIRKQLVRDLKKAGTHNAVTADLVDKYMILWDVEDGEGMAQILCALQVAPKTKRRQELENEIREQLAVKGLRGKVFEDRIDTFLKLWDAFQEANRSLVERGRTYFTISSAGKEYEKDNSASKDLVTLAKAMEDILDSLEITVKGYADPEDDEL